MGCCFNIGGNMRMLITLLLCFCFSAFGQEVEDKYKPFDISPCPITIGIVSAQTIDHKILPVAPESYKKMTQEQIKLMTLAYQIGTEIGQPQFAEVVQGILMQESHAGAGGRIGGLELAPKNRYFGVTQMKPMAVFDVLQSFPEMLQKYFTKPLEQITWNEVKNKLLKDDEFAIRMAAHYYFKYASQANTVAYAVMSYNAGPGAVKKLRHPQLHPYYVGVKKYIELARDFNKKLFEPYKANVDIAQAMY